MNVAIHDRKDSCATLWYDRENCDLLSLSIARIAIFIAMFVLMRKAFLALG
jgi:hypothetical protein